MGELRCDTAELAELAANANGGIPAPSGIQYEQAARPICTNLSPAERFLLWIVRALAENQGNWALVQRELWLRCGPARIELVLQALHEMLTTLAIHRRRVLSVRKLGSPRVSADEVTMLTLIAAAQAQQPCKVAALARWLVRNNGHDLLIAQTTQFARGLMQSGIVLASATADRE